MWRVAVEFFYIYTYDVFYVLFAVLSCDYFARNDEINEQIYIYICRYSRFSYLMLNVSLQ